MGHGGVFRIRPHETASRAAPRSELFQRLDTVVHPLQGLDLRTGDEANFPTSTSPSSRNRSREIEDRDAPTLQIERLDPLDGCAALLSSRCPPDTRGANGDVPDLTAASFLA